jgi:hypothetical protein
MLCGQSLRYFNLESLVTSANSQDRKENSLDPIVLALIEHEVLDLLSLLSGVGT